MKDAMAKWTEDYVMFVEYLKCAVVRICVTRPNYTTADVCSTIKDANWDCLIFHHIGENELHDLVKAYRNK